MRSRGSVLQRGRTFSVVIDRGADPVTGKRLRDWYPGYTTQRKAEQARTKLLHELDAGF